MTKILCAETPEAMFPLRESRESEARTPEELRALRVCLACPVLASCRRAVLDMEMPYGVAGGLTASERRAARAAYARTLSVAS